MEYFNFEKINYHIYVKSIKFEEFNIIKIGYF